MWSVRQGNEVVDWLEIGASTFSVWDVQTLGKKKQWYHSVILIEPYEEHCLLLKEMYPIATVMNVAVSDHDGEVPFFYVADLDIEKNNLPKWVKGCKSIGEPHPTIKDMCVMQSRNVSLLSYESLVTRIGLAYLSVLKIDCEGHDCVILNNAFKVWSKDRNQRPMEILFEWNKLTSIEDVHHVDRVLTSSFGYYFAGRQGGDNVVYKRIMRAAIYTEGKWAFGRIYFAVRDVLAEFGIQVTFYDWAKCNFSTIVNLPPSIIIGSTYLGKLAKEANLDKSNHRFVLTTHCPIFNYQGFDEFPVVLDNAHYTCPCIEGCRNYASFVNAPVSCTPFGADESCFFTDRFAISHFMKVIGTRLKTPESRKFWLEMIKLADPGKFDFRESNYSETTPIIAELERGQEIYMGLDVYVSVTEFEGGPLSIFEAAALGLIVFTRKNVGSASKIEGIKQFETPSELLELFNYYERNVTEREEYRKAIQREVRSKWGMRYLIHKYFLPVVLKAGNEVF